MRNLLKEKNGKQPYADLFLRIFEALGYGHAGKKLLRHTLLLTFPYAGDHEIPIRFEHGSQFSGSDRVVKDMASLLKKVKVCKDKLSPPISLNTYFTSFKFIARCKIDEDVKDEDMRGVIEKASSIFTADWEKTIRELTNAIFFILFTNGDFRKRLFAFKYEDRPRSPGCSFRIVIQKFDPEVREFELDGVIRKTYRVGRSGKGSVVYWCRYNFMGREYPIYIQNHAIEALEKRIDTSKTSELLYDLALNLEKPKLKFYKGKYLLDFYMNNRVKVGYFVCSFVSGCIILRTFLFITYESTPEGDRITKKLELDRESKIYMGLEKYSTYELALKDEDLKAHLPRLNPV
jgi:hypothetical protein